MKAQRCFNVHGKAEMIDVSHAGVMVNEKKDVFITLHDTKKGSHLMFIMNESEARTLLRQLEVGLA